MKNRDYYFKQYLTYNLLYTTEVVLFLIFIKTIYMDEKSFLIFYNYNIIFIAKVVRVDIIKRTTLLITLKIPMYISLTSKNIHHLHYPYI